MEWSPKQQSALNSVTRWLDNYGPESSQTFRLFGYAGTGKTTLAKHFADSTPGLTLFAAFTGKAALVLKEKGCRNATTIHQLIYLPRDKSLERLHELEEKLDQCKKDEKEGEISPELAASTIAGLQALIDEENERLKQPSFSLNPDSPASCADLIVIDEVSMVGTRIAQDLLSFETPILVLGDTAQLPPIGDGGYFTNASPDILLDEIHRQAAGSPIIRLATSVREGKGLKYGVYNSEGHATSRVVRKGDLSIGELASFDQILVGKNTTRKMVNKRIRKEVLGRMDSLPEEGDKLVCLRNNRDLGLLNGSLWQVSDAEVVSEDLIRLKLSGETIRGETVETFAHRHHFEDREKYLPPWAKADADEFDYGYALTVHKAQGSQWPRVVVVDESRFFRQDHARWLYTGITRASESVTVIQ